MEEQGKQKQSPAGRGAQSRTSGRSGAASPARRSAASQSSARGSVPRKAGSGSSARSAASGQAPRRSASGTTRSSAPRRRGSCRPRTPLERFLRFLKRYRVFVIAGVAILALAIVLALALPSRKDDAKEVPSSESAIPSDTADVASAPTAEPTMEPNNDPIYPTNYRVLDGAFQTDRTLGLPEGAQVEDSYFDGAVFVGDSITLKLRQYVTKQRGGEYPTMLGGAQFLTAGSFSAHAALSKVSSSSLHPTINGTKMTLEDALATLGASKVYIMLGMNDAAHSGIEKSVSDMIELIGRIRAKLPGAEIFIQSATPRYTGDKPKTETLFNFDLQLYDALAAQRLDRVYFVDVAYVMRDDTGALPANYCSDKDGMAMHFTDRACLQWVKFLYTHTPPAA